MIKIAVGTADQKNPCGCRAQSQEAMQNRTPPARARGRPRAAESIPHHGAQAHRTPAQLTQQQAHRPPRAHALHRWTQTLHWQQDATSPERPAAPRPPTTTPPTAPHPSAPPRAPAHHAANHCCREALISRRCVRPAPGHLEPFGVNRGSRKDPERAKCARTACL